MKTIFNKRNYIPVLLTFFVMGFCDVVGIATSHLKADFNLSLRLAKDTFAFKEDAQYSVENTDLVKELKFDSLSKGTWYVGVQCEDTVNQTFGKYGIAYSGKTAVLNGVPYSITVSWE